MSECVWVCTENCFIAQTKFTKQRTECFSCGPSSAVANYWTKDSKTLLKYAKMTFVMMSWCKVMTYCGGVHDHELEIIVGMSWIRKRNDRKKHKSKIIQDGYLLFQYIAWYNSIWCSGWCVQGLSYYGSVRDHYISVPELKWAANTSYFHKEYLIQQK